MALPSAFVSSPAERWWRRRKMTPGPLRFGVESRLLQKIHQGRLLAQSRLGRCVLRCPLTGAKQTCSAIAGTSENHPKPTWSRWNHQRLWATDYCRPRQFAKAYEFLQGGPVRWIKPR